MSKKHLIATILGVTVYGIIIPMFIVLFSGSLEKQTNISWNPGTTTKKIGFLLITLGAIISIWAVYVQVKIGKGTPIPKLPPRKLITIGPYKYTRNPMILGAIIYYTGIMTVFGKITGYVLVILLLASMIIYIKKVEEKELEKRFGEEYKKYKQTTPFIIPYPKKKNKKGPVA